MKLETRNCFALTVFKVSTIYYILSNTHLLPSLCPLLARWIPLWSSSSSEMDLAKVDLSLVLSF